MKPQCKVFGKAGTRKRTRIRFALLLHPSHGPLHFVASHSREHSRFALASMGNTKSLRGEEGSHWIVQKRKKKSVLFDIQEVTFAGGEKQRPEIRLRSQANIQTPLAMTIIISLDIIKDHWTCRLLKPIKTLQYHHAILLLESTDEILRRTQCYLVLFVLWDPVGLNDGYFPITYCENTQAIGWKLP